MSSAKSNRELAEEIVGKSLCVSRIDSHDLEVLKVFITKALDAKDAAYTVSKEPPGQNAAYAVSEFRVKECAAIAAKHRLEMAEKRARDPHCKVLISWGAAAGKIEQEILGLLGAITSSNHSAVTSSERCVCCGCPVKVSSSREGTNSYQIDMPSAEQIIEAAEDSAKGFGSLAKVQFILGVDWLKECLLP